MVEKEVGTADLRYTGLQHIRRDCLQISNTRGFLLSFPPSLLYFRAMPSAASRKPENPLRKVFFILPSPLRAGKFSRGRVREFDLRQCEGVREGKGKARRIILGTTAAGSSHRDFILGLLSPYYTLRSTKHRVRCFVVAMRYSARCISFVPARLYHLAPIQCFQASKQKIQSFLMEEV